jgi:hypothetical protein
MATVSLGHAEEGIAGRARRWWTAARAVSLFQLVFWSLFAMLFFVLLRPRHPFADIFAREMAATTMLGLACSTVLERMHALLHARTPRLAAFVGLPLGSVPVGLAWYALADWTGDVLDPFVYTPVLLVGGELYVPAHVPAFVAILMLWSLLYVALVHRREQRVQQEQLLKTEALAQQARLRMLRYQLNPHFLFNALNSIGALASEAPDRVQRMVGELSGFLRYSLLDSERLEVTLGDELRAVAHYLEVEKVRFEDDLDVRVEVEPAAAEISLPAFLVLPLVENAIKHGQRTSPMPLRVKVSGRIQNGELHVAVQNTGKWVAATRQTVRAAGTDTGLNNVRERLRAHYGARHAFDVYEDDGWVYARIRIDDAR